MARITNPQGNSRIVGTSTADLIESAADETGNDLIFGRGGDDDISAGGGNDVLLGEGGNDILRGGSGNNTFYGGIGDDVLIGGSGNDMFAVETGLAELGTDRLVGGSGFDRVVFRTASVIDVNGEPIQLFEINATQGVFVNMINTFRPGFVGTINNFAGGDAAALSPLAISRGRITSDDGGRFADIEQFELTSSTDVFLDSDASHIILGGGGNDFISGGGGADTIDGGTGNDTAVYTVSRAAVSVVLQDFGSGPSASGGEAEGDRLISIENVFGSSFNDFIVGDQGANILRGLGGNDFLSGGNGIDTLDGGAGDDTLRGGLRDDTIIGGEGIDTAVQSDWNGLASSFLSTLRGTITLGEGTNTGTAVLTRTTTDLVTRTITTTTLEVDRLTGIENVTGSDHADTITGNSAANRLEGRGGNDILDGGRGNDVLIGGNGNDTVIFNASRGLEQVSVTASLLAGTATVVRSLANVAGSETTETDTMSGIENLTGGNGNDSLTGDAGANVLGGGSGDDVLAGLGGADRLIGGEGIDTADYRGSTEGVSVDLQAGIGAGGDAEEDTLVGIENVEGSDRGDRLTGSTGANTINGHAGDDLIEGGAGADRMDGGSGIDTLSYFNAAAVAMSLDGLIAAVGDALGDVVFNFENLEGSNTGDDRLRGDAADNIIFGRGGDDVLEGGAGADGLDGGEGFDTADYSRDGAVTIDLASGVLAGAALGDSFVSIEAIIGGREGSNVISGDDLDNHFTVDGGNNTLQGRGGNDTLIAGIGRDTLSGGAGNDILRGGGGADQLQGGAGNDVLDGGAGNDELNGGNGDDTLSGGAGRDSFIFTGRNTGRDTITDFEGGIDRIVLDHPDLLSISDLAIAGNGTGHVVIVFGGQSIDVFGAQPITLTSADFSFL